MSRFMPTLVGGPTTILVDSPITNQNIKCTINETFNNKKEIYNRKEKLQNSIISYILLLKILIFICILIAIYMYFYK
jgi:hypothetical protein